MDIALQGQLLRLNKIVSPEAQHIICEASSGLTLGTVYKRILRVKNIRIKNVT